MSLKHPFKPAGTCEHCRFSAPPTKGSAVARHFPLLCFRFPPTPATGFSDVWSRPSAVQLKDFCAEFEVDGPTKQGHADDYHNSLTQDDIR